MAAGRLILACLNGEAEAGLAVPAAVLKIYLMPVKEKERLTELSSFLGMSFNVLTLEALRFYERYRRQQIKEQNELL